MIKVQKVIKYCAIAFAIFLIVNIISAIMYGIISLGKIFSNDNNNNDNVTEKLETLEVNNEIKDLDIEVKSVNLIIKEGTDIKVETNNKYIKLKENYNQLSIIEEKHNLINNTDSSLIIYIPNKYLFDNISIENGAGKIEIDTIDTKKIKLDLGAGKVDIQNLNVSNETDIDGGTGEVIIKNGNINNLDLDMGVGKLTLKSTITGNSDIDAGIGDLNLDLIGTEYDYKILVNKGIGKATLNGATIKNDTYYGTGSTIINIDGGIGNIKINYSK